MQQGAATEFQREIGLTPSDRLQFYNGIGLFHLLLVMFIWLLILSENNHEAIVLWLFLVSSTILFMITFIKFSPAKLRDRIEKERAIWSCIFQEGKLCDNIETALYHEVSQAIDCTQCGNCCRALKSLFSKKESKLLAEFINMPEDKFVEHYTEFDNNEKKLKFKEIPCSFLKDNKCTVYECRPSDCRSFPHLHKKGFTTRLIDVLQNYSICPIVFNVYEQLKIEMRFR